MKWWWISIWDRQTKICKLNIIQIKKTQFKLCAIKRSCLPNKSTYWHCIEGIWPNIDQIFAMHTNICDKYSLLLNANINIFCCRYERDSWYTTGENGHRKFWILVAKNLLQKCNKNLFADIDQNSKFNAEIT